MIQIEKAQKHAKQAKMVSPPCPVFTAAAIASYDEAILILTTRRNKLQQILDEQRE